MHFLRRASKEWIRTGSRSIGPLAHEKVVEILAKAGLVELSPVANRELERALQRAIARVAA